MDNNYIDNSFNNMMLIIVKVQLVQVREWWVGVWVWYFFEWWVGKCGFFMSGRWVGVVFL